MAKQDFISEALYKGTKNIDQKNNQEVVENIPEPKSDKTFKKALERRLSEYIKFKRDITAKYSESLAKFPDEIESCEDYFNCLHKANNQFKEIYDKIESLDDSQWNDNFSAQLANAMRFLEDSRLEHIRNMTQMEKFSSIKNNTQQVANSFIPEMLSLSFKQLFKLGLYFFLPLIIAIFLSAIILAISYTVAF